MGRAGWWLDWREWLRRRSGPEVDAPKSLGDERRPVLSCRPPGATSLSDRAGLAPDDTAERAAGVEARLMSVGGQELMVAVKRGADSRRPLLLFNGIGANWELARPFLEALTETTAIIFDMPGNRRLASAEDSRIVRRASLDSAPALSPILDIMRSTSLASRGAGGSHSNSRISIPKLCRRLVLAATSPGAIMVPGRPQAILRMATPRRYWDKAHMTKIAPEIYGGAFRKDPSMRSRHAEAMFGPLGHGLHLSAARHGRLD